MAVLVTGGAGFIGSHTCVELLRRGHDVMLADDYSNSSPAAVAAIREVSGRDLAVHRIDVCDKSALDQWWDALHLGEASFWRMWKRPLPR